MKISKIVSFIHDIGTKMKVSLKLIMKDKITVFVFLASCVCFFFLCATLNFSAEDQSRIPIGLANLDMIDDSQEATMMSQVLYDKVKLSPSFRVVAGTVDQLTRALENGEINCVFIIKNGYQERLRTGFTKGLIQIYKSKGNKNAAMLADIFAGEMIDEICLQKSYLAYKKLDFTGFEELTRSEYEQYVEQMKTEDDFKFSFEVELFDPDIVEVDYNKLDNAVLYREIIAGIFAMLLSFVILFSYTYVCMEKEQGILRRERITLQNRLANMLGILLSVLLTTFLLCLIFVACVCYYTKSQSAFGPLLNLSLGYALIMSIVFFFLARVTKGILSYQMIGAITILILGMLGFCTIVDGIAFKKLIILLENTPNGWFIERFVDIILK